MTVLDWAIVAFTLALGALGLPAGVDRRRADPGRLRRRRLRRQPDRRRWCSRRAPTRPTRRSARRSGRCWSAPWSAVALESFALGLRAKLIRRPGPAPRRRGRRRGADRLGRARPRLGVRRRRPARAGDGAAARRRPALADPAQPQRRAAAVGAGPQRARPRRPGALDRRPGDARSRRPTRRSPPTPTCCGAGRSVVRVLGTACGLGIEGSGWAVRPGPGRHQRPRRRRRGRHHGDDPGRRRARRDRRSTTTRQRPRAAAGRRRPAGPADRRRREPRHRGRRPRLPGERPLRARRRRGSARPARRSARTPTATARSTARSPRCAATCAAATPAGRWSTPRAASLGTVFAATTGGPPGGFAIPAEHRPRGARAGDRARSTPAPARAESPGPSLTFSKLGRRGTGPATQVAAGPSPASARTSTPRSS